MTKKERKKVVRRIEFFVKNWKILSDNVDFLQDKNVLGIFPAPGIEEPLLATVWLFYPCSFNYVSLFLLMMQPRSYSDCLVWYFISP